MASILYPAVSGDSHYYMDDIRRTSPGHYLVRFRTPDHPSVRVCYLFHLDLPKKREVSRVQAPCD